MYKCITPGHWGKLKLCHKKVGMAPVQWWRAGIVLVSLLINPLLAGSWSVTIATFGCNKWKTYNSVCLNERNQHSLSIKDCLFEAPSWSLLVTKLEVRGSCGVFYIGRNTLHWLCCTGCTGSESGVRTWEKDVMTLDKGIMVTCWTLDGIG